MAPRPNVYRVQSLGVPACVPLVSHTGTPTSTSSLDGSIRINANSTGIAGSDFDPDFSVITNKGLLPGSDMLARGALLLWYRASWLRDFLLALFALNLLHVSLVTRFHGTKTDIGDCAASSWIVFLFVCVITASIIAFTIVRQVRNVGASLEIAFDIYCIGTAIVLASAAAPHDWRLNRAGGDICSLIANPLAYGIYQYADILGIGAFIRTLLLLYVRPPFGYGLVWVLAVALIGVVFQLFVLDEYLVPELSTVWKEVEINGTAIDNDLNDFADRLTDVEKLLNVSDY